MATAPGESERFVSEGERIPLARSFFSLTPGNLPPHLHPYPPLAPAPALNLLP